MRDPKAFFPPKIQIYKFIAFGFFFPTAGRPQEGRGQELLRTRSFEQPFRCLMYLDYQIIK